MNVIDFTVATELTLDGVVLQIRGGRVMAIEAGSVRGEGIPGDGKPDSAGETLRANFFTGKDRSRRRCAVTSGRAAASFVGDQRLILPT